MISFSDPQRTLVGLHDMLTGWQSIRERRRMRYSPPTATASPSPPASMQSPPVGAPSAPGPTGPDRATVIAFRKLGDRVVPIFGDPAELDDAAAHASANRAPNPPEARGAEAPAPKAPPQAAPDASSEPPAPPRGQSTPPPPDFTPQAVEASAPRQSPAAPPTLNLPPPTPPPLVRVDEQAVTLERVFADHRVHLARQTEAQQAQHATVMEAILAEHRRAQAQADQAHRQQLGELLAKHREEVQGMAVAIGEHGHALVDLREILAEQASAMQAEHARIGEKIESIVDIVGMVGETVHHIAAVALQTKAPQFGALPTRPITTAPGVTDRPTQASPQRAVIDAARVLPVRPPAQQASPQQTVTDAARVLPVRPPVQQDSTQPAMTPTAEQVASPTITPQVAAPQPTATSPASPPLCVPDVTATRPRLAAVPARGEPYPAPAEPSHQAPPPTPRQLRAEAAARERSRLDEAVADLTFDDDSAESGDELDASEAPDA